jgi:hypothetical protein
MTRAIIENTVTLNFNDWSVAICATASFCIISLIWSPLPHEILEQLCHCTQVIWPCFWVYRPGYLNNSYIGKETECSPTVKCVQYFLCRGSQNTSRNVRTICSEPSCDVCLVRWWLKSCNLLLTLCWQHVGKNDCSLDIVACMLWGLHGTGTYFNIWSSFRWWGISLLLWKA